MRFLMICMQYPLGRGESYLTTELADGLAAAGHEVQVLLLDWSSAPGGAPEELVSPTGVRVLRCSPRRLNLGRTLGDASKFVLSGVHLALAARRKLDLSGCDAAIAWMPLTAIGPLVPMLKKAGIRHRLLFIWDFFPNHHREIGRVTGGLPYVLARAWERHLTRFFTTVFCTLPGNVDYFRRNYPVGPGQQLRVAPVWCDPTPHEPVARVAIRQHHGLPADRPIAVFGGQLSAGRGFEQIFAAARDSAAANSSLLFLFVGDGPLAETVRERSRETDNVRWLPPMDRESYLDLLGGCDVGMVATVPGVTSYSMPSKTLDYLRSGLPVIAAVERGNAFIDLLERYAVGTAVEFGEPAQFREQAERLATDRRVREQIPAAARRCLDEVFDVRHAVESVIQATAPAQR